VNGSDTNLYFYISAGTGTAEAAQLVTTGGAGTCTSGASSGTVKIVPANNHTGAWTVSSWDSGAYEAAVANPTLVVNFAGTLSWYAPVQWVCGHPGINGQGQQGGTNVNLYFNAATVLTGCGFPAPAFNNFRMLPVSGDMTAGAMIYVASGQYGMTTQNLALGSYGQGAYIGIECNSYPCLGSNVQILAAYRGEQLGADAHQSFFHITSDKTTSTYISGGAALYINYSTAGQFDNFYSDAGVFESGVVFDSSSNEVGESLMTNSYFDHYKTYGLKTISGGVGMCPWWNISNTQFVDNSGADTAVNLYLTNCVMNWTIDGMRNHFYVTGVELNGAQHVNIGTSQIYPMANSGTAIVVDATTATNNVVLAGNTIGIGLDSGGSSHTAAYGLRFVDSSSSNFTVTGNTLRGTTAAVSFATSSGGGMQFANNLGLNTAIPLLAVSGSTLTVGVYPIVGLSSTTAFNTMTGSATAGQQVTLINYTASAVTINTGGNFGLGHTLAANGGSETFSFDGTNWY
jgi:hypothetical protein